MLKKIKHKLHSVKVEKNRILNLPSSFDEAIISWVAPEIIRHEKGVVWKTIATLLVIISIILAFLYDAWSFGLAIFACAVVYFLEHLQHPKEVEIKISEIGVKAGVRKYPFSKIKAFWIIYDLPYVATLNLRVMGQYPGYITIQLDGQNPSEVREYLINKIPELTGQNETLSDILIRLFKI